MRRALRGRAGEAARRIVAGHTRPELGQGQVGSSVHAGWTVDQLVHGLEVRLAGKLLDQRAKQDVAVVAVRIGAARRKAGTVLPHDRHIVVDRLAMWTDAGSKKR